MVDSSFIPYLFLTFFIGYSINLLEVCTSKYPNTCGFLIFKSWKLHVYCVIYGLISSVSLMCIWILLPLNPSSTPTLIESLIHDPLIQAIVVGTSAKAIFHINIFSARIGSMHVPIGLETLCCLFEPYLLRQVELEEYCSIRTYIEEKSRAFNDVGDVKGLIRKNIPNSSVESDKDVFLVDLKKRKTKEDSMELYFRKFGKKNFDRLFDH
jgi:hypothetical protein